MWELDVATFQENGFFFYYTSIQRLKKRTKMSYMRPFIHYMGYLVVEREL